jgi:hypothetical protein
MAPDTAVSGASTPPEPTAFGDHASIVNTWSTPVICSTLAI